MSNTFKYCVELSVPWREVCVNIVVLVSVRNCKRTTRGTEYMGPLSVSVTGQPCSNWNESIFNYFLNLGLGDQANYCRNPESLLQPLPMCLIKDSNEVCKVPYCGKLLAGKIAAYGYDGVHYKKW